MIIIAVAWLIDKNSTQINILIFSENIPVFLLYPQSQKRAVKIESCEENASLAFPRKFRTVFHLKKELNQAGNICPGQELKYLIIFKSFYKQKIKEVTRKTAPLLLSLVLNFKIRIILRLFYFYIISNTNILFLIISKFRSVHASCLEHSTYYWASKHIVAF